MEGLDREIPGGTLPAKFRVTEQEEGEGQTIGSASVTASWALAPSERVMLEGVTTIFGSIARAGPALRMPK
ncbi:MAG: hypothetical protein ACKOHN_11350, partial [Actinomycetota bacterium]